MNLKRFGTDPFIRCLAQRRMKKLTTVIAVRCSDGVIMCTDTQETIIESGGAVAIKETVSKVKPITKYSLLGCAGMPNYIDRLYYHIEKAFLKYKKSKLGYFDILDKGVESYSNYVDNRGGYPTGIKPPVAICVAVDRKKKTYHIYELKPPHPPREISHINRIAIGSGMTHAILLFKMAEKLLSKMDYDWHQLSTTFVSKFCYLVIGRIAGYDLYSSPPTTFYKIDTKRYALLSDKKIFPDSPKRYRLSQLIESAIQDLPARKLELLVKTYLDDKLMQELLTNKVIKSKVDDIIEKLLGGKLKLP